MKKIFTIMAVCGWVIGVFASNQHTNWKSGISLDMQGVDGTDYAFERWYHDALIDDHGVIYIKAATNALLNRREKFKITCKEDKSSIPLWRLWPQLLFTGTCFFSIIWGLNRIYFSREPFMTLCFNTFWCFYNFIIAFSIIFFNYIPEKNEKK